MISSGVSALSILYPDSLDRKDPDQVELSSIRLFAKMLVLAAYAYKTSLGQALLYPDNSLGKMENFFTNDSWALRRGVRSKPNCHASSRYSAPAACRP